MLYGYPPCEHDFESRSMSYVRMGWRTVAVQPFAAW